MEPPDHLKCKSCYSLCKNAVSLPCCHAVACRGCAVKNIIKNKDMCFIKGCSKQITLTQLLSNEEVRKECEKFNEGIQRKPRRRTD